LYNKVSPYRDVTILARRAVSAAQPPSRPARSPAALQATDDDRRRPLL